MYCLFSPHWIQGSRGRETDIFTIITYHFDSRATYELNQSGGIKSILTKAQNKIARALDKKYQGSFRPGCYASADYFIEVILDTSKNKAVILKTLFNFTNTLQYHCAHFPEKHHSEDTRTENTIKITRNAFDGAEIDHHNISALLEQWTTTAITIKCGRVCTTCKEHQKGHYEEESTSTPTTPSSESSTVEVVKQIPNSSFNPPDLIKHSTLKLESKPLHLYFHLEVTSILDLDERASNPNYPGFITSQGVAELLAPHRPQILESTKEDLCASDGNTDELFLETQTVNNHANNVKVDKKVKVNQKVSVLEAEVDPSTAEIDGTAPSKRRKVNKRAVLTDSKDVLAAGDTSTLKPKSPKGLQLPLEVHLTVNHQV
ncbi:uncharacterized protein MELLADRAFT_104073 [Melampsora larici-populina 98AG31]|uniref:Uncharacterized protein n=1 Tax=Melampsora larici-populina (strain 98AG31 / pathotype 3-4-7) TaxID=747676 RepID=F4RDG7_MELLP|nr:uncharacterized protein MELLADRAFT_104073 [Melampsora larici-populina 98AG31]EGG09613.1 hypothetical protein MELLADRAFT_104073 [Melampsora larici-populina 98AG31]